MLNVHPPLVHFPIALLMAALFLDVLGIVLRREGLHGVASWNMALGALGSIAAVITGLMAEATSGHGGPVQELVAVHRILGIAVVVLAVGLTAWRLAVGGLPSGALKLVYLCLALGMVVVLAVGAHYGGRMVYEFGYGAALSGAAQ